MAITQKATYVKQWDTIVGNATHGVILQDSNKENLTNRLIVFVVKGLSKTYRIPIAYYFVRKLTADFLYEVTKQVVKVDERSVFSVQ